MNTAALVLLIIVSSVLAVFLLVLTGVAIYFIRVLKELRRITARAEDVVETTATAMGRVVSPLAVFRLIGGIVSHNQKARKKRG